MNDSELETLLRESAPQPSLPPDLVARRIRVFGHARSRHGRRTRLWIGGAVASVLLLGGGTMAVAGGDHMTPWGWMADNSVTVERPAGSDCFLGMRVTWEGVPADDPMVREAKEILGAMDLQSLDISERLAEDRAANEAVKGAGKQTEEELRMSAMSIVAAWSTLDELAARGYEMRPGHEVSISTEGTRCR